MMAVTNEYDLHDEMVIPDEAVLKRVMGENYIVYLELIALFDKNQMEYGWRYYHDGNTWLCKVVKKKKTIVWMSVCKSAARATIYIPDKYMDSLHALALSEERKQILAEAAKPGKSTACTFEFHDRSGWEDFNQLMQFKLSLK